MSKTKYICHHCNKEYSRKIYFDRHLLCCNLKALAMEKGSVELEEMNDTPSQRELYLMLQELIKKQYDMEKEIKRLKQISFRDSGTTTVFQKLESISMTFDFESWTCFSIIYFCFFYFNLFLPQIYSNHYIMRMKKRVSKKKAIEKLTTDLDKMKMRIKQKEKRRRKSRKRTKKINKFRKTRKRRVKKHKKITIKGGNFLEQLQEKGWEFATTAVRQNQERGLKKRAEEFAAKQEEQQHRQVLAHQAQEQRKDQYIQNIRKQLQSNTERDFGFSLYK